MMPRRRHNHSSARVIQRTTSETMRIGDPDLVIVHHSPATSAASASSTKSNKHPPLSASLSAAASSSASFVVTGVSKHDPAAVCCESPDSEECSRQTDVDTPSFSEDTSYSQYTEDVDYCACEEIILKRCANAVVGGGGDELLVQTAAIHAVSAPIRIVPATPTEVDGGAVDTIGHMPSPGRFIGRFQVVKVESIHPFRRGRWICHDYVDNSEYAPRDGYEFFRGRFVKRKELEDIKKKMDDETFIFDTLEAADDGNMKTVQPVTIVHNSTTPLVFMNAPVLSSTYHPILRNPDHHTADGDTFNTPDLISATQRSIIRPGECTYFKMQQPSRSCR